MRVSNKRAVALSAATVSSLFGLSSQPEFAHASTTYLGDAVNYSFGTVQVQITVDSNNKITQIDTPQVSRSGSNGSYTNYALPTLVEEALAAQSASIQAVSGASYLSRGWITSLASAIAKEGTVTTTTTPAPAPVASTTPTPRPTPLPTRSVAPEPQGGEAEGFGNGFGDDANRPRPEGENEGEGEHRLPPLRKSPTPIVKSPAPIVKSPTPSTLSAAPSDPGLTLKPGAGVIQRSITCVKGATKKVIKGLNPKCPTGFTLKKP